MAVKAAVGQWSTEVVKLSRLASGRAHGRASLREGAIALLVTLSGSALFAS